MTNNGHDRQSSAVGSPYSHTQSESIPAVPRQSKFPPVVPPDCQGCPIRKSTVCQAFKLDELNVLEDFKTGDRILPAGTTLYQEGEPISELYNLLDGWVVLHRILTSGRRQILEFVLPGAFLGYQPDLKGSMLHGAKCLTDVVVCVFPRHSFPSFIRRHPEVAAQLASIKARDEARAHDHLTNIGARPSRARLAHLLLGLHIRVRRWYPTTDDGTVELPLTQDNIADALGLTNVHVNKMLRTLREDGLLEFKNGKLNILDAKRLAAIGEPRWRLESRRRSVLTRLQILRTFPWPQRHAARGRVSLGHLSGRPGGSGRWGPPGPLGRHTPK